jgi:hypothetical protein
MLIARHRIIRSSLDAAIDGGAMTKRGSSIGRAYLSP